MIKRKYLAISILVMIMFNIIINFESFANSEGRVEEKSILIINSFTEEHNWTNNVLKGMLKTINHSEFDVNIYMESFDYKFCNENEAECNIKDIIESKYIDKKLDLIISTDLDATEFVIKNQERYFKDIPIAFSGITKSKAQEIINSTYNVTGVVEKPNIESTLKTAFTINPDAENIYVIHDNTARGKRYFDEIKESSLKLNDKLNVENFQDIDSIERGHKLPDIPPDSVIIGTALLKDKTGKDVPMSRILRKIDKEINMPIFYLQESGLGHGVLGGNVLSPEKQGLNIGNLALRILRGEDPKEIGLIEEENTQNIFDYNVMEKFNISEKSLPKNSIILNKPQNIYEEYKNIIIGICFVILLLIILIIYLFTNINKRKQVEKEMKIVNKDLINMKKKLESIAYYDDVTGLANRDMFYSNMRKKLNNKSEEIKGSILYLDIDDFRDVNDLFGHSFGDLLLNSLGNRLKTITNKTENSNIELYRISGDEYLLDLVGKDKKTTKKIAKDIKELVSEKFNIQNQRVKISVSIGIVFYPKDGLTVEEIFKKAELSMYKAKALGKNCYKIYEEVMEEEIAERVIFENNLKEALDQDEFVLNYQPQIDLNNEEIVGFESLIRWHSSEYGLVSPGKFIPVAETTGEITEIGEWILREACKFSLEINRKREFNKNIEISVNISPIQLKQNDFVDMVRRIIYETGANPKNIGIEVTETALMESFDESVTKLKTLKDSGIKIYLDDFGTGYSSLNYLLKLPINTIKIDKSFIDDMMTSKKGRNITKKIINLAHDMDLEVVAEGVEEENQLVVLKKFECDIIQGYIYGKPLSEKQAKKYIDKDVKVR